MTYTQYYHIITRHSEQWAERFFPRSVAAMMRSAGIDLAGLRGAREPIAGAKRPVTERKETLHGMKGDSLQDARGVRGLAALKDAGEIDYILKSKHYGKNKRMGAGQA